MHYQLVKYSLMFALLVAICLVVGLITKAHWWMELAGAEVVYDGRNLPNAQVYRSPNGEMLVKLADQSEDPNLFVLYPNEDKVGLPNHRHFFFLPGYVFSRYLSPPVVFMHSAKAEIDPKLTVGPRTIEFTTLRDRRVQILLLQ